jgi:hypothetical protein
MCYTGFIFTRKKDEYSLVIDYLMPVDKAKESAAIAAVDEQINSVG